MTRSQTFGVMVLAEELPQWLKRDPNEPDTPMMIWKPKSDHRFVMESVAELHKRGYGRLKLFCYLKEGVAAWRHWLFADDKFPDTWEAIPKPKLHGSVPWLSSPTFDGDTVEEAADRFVLTNPELAEAARGTDPGYVNWYAEMISMDPFAILEMESSTVAWLDNEIRTPYVSPEEFSRRSTPPVWGHGQ